MKSKLTRLGSVMLGDKFVYRSTEMLGYQPTRIPSFEGQVLTVVGFRLHYVNQIVARDETGQDILMPLSMVEKSLCLQPIKTMDQIQ
jgi:hypothetical protein